MGVNDVLFNPMIYGSGEVASGATLTIEGTLAMSGSLTIDGSIDASGAATGDFDILLGDNLASGLDISEAANTYLRFVTTNSGEHMLASKKLRFADSNVLSLGNDDDVTLTHDGTTTVQVAGLLEWQDDEVIHFGDDGDCQLGYVTGTDTATLNATSATLALTTTTTGNIDITAADDINIAAAGSDLDLDAATLTADFTGVASIDAVGNSSLTIDTGNLNIATTTTGSIELDGVDGVNIESSAGVLRMGADNIAQAVAIGTAGARAISIGSAAAASFLLDAGIGGIDIDCDTTFDLLAGGAFSIDGTGASNVTAEAGNLTLSTGTSGDLIFTSASGEITANDLIKLNAAGGADSANGLLMGVGTSGTPATTAVAGKNMMEFRVETTATSDDFRGFRLDADFNGIGVSGDAIRGRGLVTAAGTAGTVDGGAFTLEYNGGSVAGMGTGLRGNLVVSDAAVSGGTVYGTLAEIYSLGASTDLSGATQHAILGVESNGNGTGADTVLNAISFAGNTDGSGYMIYTHGHAEGNAAGSVRVLINGVAKFIKFWDAE